MAPVTGQLLLSRQRSRSIASTIGTMLIDSIPASSQNKPKYSGERYAICVQYENELIPIPYHAIMVVVFTKETTGLECKGCTFVDEFIARVHKNWRPDEEQSTQADYRTLMNAHIVFGIYEYIKNQGGIMRVFPNEDQLPVAQVLAEFIHIFRKMPDWRGLDHDERQVLTALKQLWIDWSEESSETEESNATDMKNESEIVPAGSTLGGQDAGTTQEHDVRASQVQDVRTTQEQDARTSREQNARTLQEQDVRAIQEQDIPITQEQTELEASTAEIKAEDTTIRADSSPEVEYIKTISKPPVISLSSDEEY